MGSLMIASDQLDASSLDQLLLSKENFPASLKLDFPHLGYTESLFLLNDADLVERYRSKESRMATLSLHNVRVPSTTSSIVRQYVVVLFQTEVLLTYRTKNQGVGLAGRKQERFYRVSPTDQSREVRRIHTLATRALYALGLDYGVVKAAVLQGNLTAVSDVIPGARLHVEIGRHLAGAVIKYGKSLPQLAVSLKSVMLGADPEFIMESLKGQIVLASKYFPRFGPVGCDAIWQGRNRSHKPVVELRPKPTNQPRQLVVRMYQGMQKANQRVKHLSLRWLAGGLPHAGFPLGGHIHFSGVHLNFKLLRALDNYLALPLVLAEDPRGIKRRPKYGFLGDFRRQFHGGFEYRTLPSWLVSPTLTKGVIAAAQVIAAQYPYLRYNPLKDSSIQTAYYQGSKGKLKKIVPTLWRDLARLPEYKEYQTYLDGLFRMLLSGTTWDERIDFRRRWKLAPYNR